MAPSKTATFLASCIGLLGMATVTQGTSVYTGSYLDVGAGQFTLTVWITGGGAVRNADVLLVIGDGGPAVGGTTDPVTAPRIVGGSNNSGIFAGNNGGNLYYNVLDDPLIAYNGAITDFGTTVPGEGVLMTFLIDTTNTVPGVYPFHLHDPDTSVNGHRVDLAGGIITVLPEPTAGLLMVAGGLLLRSRRQAV